MNVSRLQAIRRTQQYYLLPVKPGMMLEIHEKIGEGNNQRIWKFKGIVLKMRKPSHIDGSFTIRGKTSGHMIEKIYPLSFPNFEHVYLLDKYKIARAKLYYLRDKIGKDAKMKSKISAQERGVDLLIQAKEATAQETPVSEQTQEQASVETSEEAIVTEEINKQATNEPIIEQPVSEASHDHEENIIPEEKIKWSVSTESVAWESESVSLEEITSEENEPDVSIKTEKQKPTEELDAS